jgi:hypothetical protein
MINSIISSEVGGGTVSVALLQSSMAFSGQAATHRPQPRQRVRSTVAVFWSSSSFMAATWHLSSHAPHSVHNSGSTAAKKFVAQWLTGFGIVFCIFNSPQQHPQQEQIASGACAFEGCKTKPSSRCSEFPEFAAALANERLMRTDAI